VNESESWAYLAELFAVGMCGVRQVVLIAVHQAALQYVSERDAGADQKAFRHPDHIGGLLIDIGRDDSAIGVDRCGT
jgi:hypothetical protein